MIDGEAAKRGRYCQESGQLQLTPFDQFRINLIATSNAALNDYENYFLRLVQIKGYKVTLQNEKAKVEVSTKEVKAMVAANSLTESEFKELDKKANPTQAETNAIKRYKVKQATGKNDFDLTVDDVLFCENENGFTKIANAELVNVENIEALKEADRQNHETQAKLSSKTSKAFLLSYIVNALRDKPVKRALIQFCLDFLHENHAEVAINGLGNFSYKTANTRIIRT